MSPFLKKSWQSILGDLHSASPPHAWCLVHTPAVVADSLTDHLARSLLWQVSKNGEPCGECVSCRFPDPHPDILTLGPEGAAGMIKIDLVREAIEVAYITASMGRCRVIIVRPADCLNLAASNALLKVVEEPPSGTVFIFQTAVLGKLLPTLVSRLRMVKVPVPEQQILEKTAKNLGINGEDILLSDALLAEPTAVQTAPERLALARDVLDALVRIRFGEDSQVVLKRFGKVDMLTASTVMERVCDQLIRAQFQQPSQNPITAALSAPYPEVRLLYHYKERISEVRIQAQAGIAVNSVLALGSLFAAWAFIWARVPRK
ncbi:MAG TPA: hypothetical protein DEF72_04765 [Gammaproteobacteria bacterium]|nr:hypothetical protein [Gammaproteobacteria bacterium]